MGLCVRVRGRFSISFENEIVKLCKILSQMKSVLVLVLMVRCFQFTTCEKSV